MTTKVTFDAATLADAVSKAARIAPTKGAAYDQAAGLMMVIDTTNSKCILKSTNLDVTYRQELALTDAKGDSTEWRVPAPILAGLMSNLPLGNGSQVKFIDSGDQNIRIQCGEMLVKLTMHEGMYPTIDKFDQENMSEANDFASKVSQVSWACERDNSILSGVHVQGEMLVGCNRMVAAMVPCKVPIAKPVTVPLWTVAPVLGKASDVRISASEKLLNVSLDAETQLTTRIYEGDYPDVTRLLRSDFEGQIELHRGKFVETMERMLVVSRTERQPTVKLTINGTGLINSMTFDMDVESVGRIRDTMDVSGEYDSVFEIHVTPSFIIPAVNNARDEMVTLKFGCNDFAKSKKVPLIITDTKGYVCLVTPRVVQ